jgi:hypothetical protein
MRQLSQEWNEGLSSEWVYDSAKPSITITQLPAHGPQPPVTTGGDEGQM